jgi:hypothetical protein
VVSFTPSRFTPGKDPTPPLDKTGWVPEPVFALLNSNSYPSAVELVASRCTDCAIFAHTENEMLQNYSEPKKSDELVNILSAE